MKDITIVICSYNYERFLREAIDSALAQEPQRTQVVVIDDGSTDGSRDIIASYGARVTPVLKANGGQASSYNLGLEMADTEYILYLDSDDVLYEGAVAQVLDTFERGGYAKVQFTLDVIDGDSRSIGVCVPHSQPPAECAGLLRSGWLYPSPPASGNAYRVSALKRVLPLPKTTRRGIAADFFAIYGVALVGPVGVIDTPLGGYRVHRPANESGATAKPRAGLSIANSQDVAEVVQAFPQRWDALRELVSERLGEQLPEQPMDFSYEKAHLCLRVYNAPLWRRWHWIVFDSRRYFRSILANPFWTTRKKFAAVALTLLCLLPLRSVSDHAIRFLANPLARGTQTQRS
ncbi:glycosyltransferase family 2 protein [Paraburkholderia pallida]|uniref:Glycosyltransferase family 2 protein n=1 Tax=Paraburkholderia pallida TaxID=2547399 RepID=A0A4P7CVT3_9BURK|nr:glycosyltransferase family 2 protein [Paraburkholderia pallida]QBR00276.1 glycosyltransferase family 2 protein [Paraburkholderia pallida]